MKFYRYHEYPVYKMGMRIQLREYSLLKETPCGYWICQGGGGIHAWGKHWVSKTARKRYAYTTKGEALQNFLARKKRQVEILTYRLGDAKQALRKGKEIKLKELSCGDEK